MTSALAAVGIGQRLAAAAILAAVFAGSAASTALLWRWLGARMRRDRWMRPNYRGERIVAVSGLLVVAVSAVAAVAVAVMAYRSAGWTASASLQTGRTRWLDAVWQIAPADGFPNPAMTSATGAVAVALALVAFGLLGYRDDVRGHGDVGGFVAHIARSWRQRRLTTGVQKALGGGAAAVLCVQMALFGSVASLWSSQGWADGAAVARSLRDLLVHPHGDWAAVPLLRGALIVALGANALNLFDRVPGRAVKVALAWWLCALVPAALAGFIWPQQPHVPIPAELAGQAWSQGPQLPGVGVGWLAWQSPALWAAAAVGGSMGLLRSELREQHMLGDTGVNPVGAALGMATVATFSAPVEWAVLALLAALNLASERWSFSRIIDAAPPLRWLDRLGSPYRN